MNRASRDTGVRRTRALGIAITVALCVSLPAFTVPGPSASAVETPPSGATNELAPAPNEGQVEAPTEAPTEAPPADPDHETVPDPAGPSDAPRGPDGGVASDSPGPTSARSGQQPANDAQAMLGAATAAAGRALIGDDYPAKYKNLPWPYQSDNIWDEWNFAYRQCTSFVSWRLNSANGVPFSNQYMGLWAWGNAGEWADSARSVGIRVDTTPEVGAVAWSGPFYVGASGFGHVAWVADVLSDGRVVIEEYNAGWAGSYSTRIEPARNFQGYIHIRDLSAPFAKTSKPSVSGPAMVGGTLAATLPAWTPAPTKISYRWLRNGAAIQGATGKTYQPSAADLGARISVEATGERTGYRPTTTASSQTGSVVMTDADGDGIDDTQQLLPWDSDVNGDGLPDAVGFGSSGVRVALRTPSGLGAAGTWSAGFGVSNGWKTHEHPRALADVDGDGRSDVVGFARDGVYVATSSGSGFSPLKRWVAGFGIDNGWDVAQHPRTVADITGDGLPDVVGFANDGVYVAVNTGTGFAPVAKWSGSFGVASGWKVAEHPRWVRDMNGDGRADLVGIQRTGVFVALSTGTGFSAAKNWSAGFGAGNGWSVRSHPRALADVNGDGLMDVVGFASDGVYVALGTGQGLGQMTRWRVGFGTVAGWLVGNHPRVLADVNGDGRADVIGFANDGVQVSLSTGTGFSEPARWTTAFGSATWRADRQPRAVTDINGDGRADIVGFGSTGVRVAESTGGAFAASKLLLADMGETAGGWQVAAMPRAMSVQTLSRRMTPTIAGQVRVGETLTGAVQAWQPRPVALTFQWLRDGRPIPGATAQKYVLEAQDLGTRISLSVMGRKPGFAQASTVSAAYTVAPGVLGAVVPQVQGTPQVGAVLSARAGVWVPSAVRLEYRWNRNGVPIPGATSGAYRLTPADVGRRMTVTVLGSKIGYTAESRTSAVTKTTGIPALPKTSPFADVPTTRKFYREIAWMHTSGLSTGTARPGGLPVYQPTTAVSREAMAAFLFRLAGSQDYVAPATSPFIDVPVTHRFYREIAWMRSSGLSTGTKTSAGAVYGPSDQVTREAMAAFLFRLERPSGFVAPRVSPFADVTTSHAFYREIAWMHAVGLSTGVSQPTGKPKFVPKDAVSREAMAAFLYRVEVQE